MKNTPLQKKAKNVLKRTPPRLKVQPRRPRGRPKADDLQALEARLVSVARQAFVLHGYGATSINAIARSARISKNTLYARFPSKAALFQAIVAQQITDTGAELRPMSGTQEDALEDRLRSYANIALRSSLSGDILEINRLILSESHKFHELGEAAHARSQTGVRSVSKIIEECAKRDRVACRNAVAAAELFLYIVYGWYQSVMISNRVVTDKERTSWVDYAVTTFMASRSAW